MSKGVIAFKSLLCLKTIGSEVRMFTIREINLETDSGAVVQLLKKTFEGPSGLEFFKWKHTNYSANLSYGLVALNDAGDIVGVRLLMWWHGKLSMYGIRKLMRRIYAIK